VDLFPDIVSRRTGNYIRCFLIGATGACLDQMWCASGVRIL
jgi:hypothetical protein